MLLGKCLRCEFVINQFPLLHKTYFTYTVIEFKCLFDDKTDWTLLSEARHPVIVINTSHKQENYFCYGLSMVNVISSPINLKIDFCYKYVLVLTVVRM